MKPLHDRYSYNVAGKVLSHTDFVLFRDTKRYEFNERKAKHVVKRAEKYLETEIPLLPASLYREFYVNGNRSNYESVFFRRRDMALYLALAESYERKGRFTEKLMDVVWAILEESTWILPAHLYNSGYGGQFTLGPVFGGKYNHGLALFSATTGATLTLVYHLCKDALDGITPIIAMKMKHEILERLEKPFLENVFWWMGDNGGRVNNWNPWIISNVLFATAILEEDQFIRERVVELALRRLDNFLGGYQPDGGCDEGASYWGAAGASLFDCLELIDDMTGGEITIYDSMLVRNIGDYIFKVNIDSDRFVNFADCPPKTLPDAALLIRYGEKCGSPFLTSFGKKLMVHGNLNISSSQLYRTLRLMCTEDIEAVDCPMPLCSYLSDLKVMTARECPDSSKGMFLAAKGGNNGESHNHNDVGNFMVYYGGKPVIIDTGVGTYTKQTFSPDRYKLWFMQSGYHNLPSFDGIDQRAGEKYRSRDEVFSEGERRLIVELREAYPAEAGIESYLRSTALTGGMVTVTDKIILDKERQIDLHLMSAVKPLIERKGIIKLAEGRTLIYPEDVLTAEIEEFDPVGMNAKAQWDTEVMYRIHLRSRAKSLEYTLIVK